MPEQKDLISDLLYSIGVNEAFTDKALSTAESMEKDHNILPILNLLLLERFTEAVHLVEIVMAKNLDLEYLKYLQLSKFYLQRLCVPIAIRNLTFEGKKELLYRSTSDEICCVVEAAVESVKKEQSFTEDELINIAQHLYNSKYSSNALLAVDIAVLTKKACPLLDSFLKSKNWKLRHRVAYFYNDFIEADRHIIADELKMDHIEEVRIQLSSSINTLDHMDLLEDPSELVREKYLSNIIKDIQDDAVFEKIAVDSSWTVRRVLLNLKGEYFKKYSIPIIKSTTENVKWRSKLEILNLIEEKVQDEYIARLLINYLFKNIKDKVFDIRDKAQAILCKIINLYIWANEYYYEIEKLVSSENYLHRLSVVPVAVTYDLKFHTELSKRLFKDSIINVRDKIKDYLEQHQIKTLLDENSTADPDTSFTESIEHC